MSGDAPPNVSAKLVRLIPHRDRLLALAEEILRDPIKCNEVDHLGAMGIIFAAKQVEHLRSIVILTDAGQFPDTMLIGRAMLEGMVVLLWAARDPDQRPYKWRTHAIVHDLELLLEKKEAGDVVPEDLEEEIWNMVRNHGRQFLKKGLTEVDEPDPSKYKSRWHLNDQGQVVTIKEMFDDFEAPLLYDVYRSLSNWVHWNAAGVGSGLTSSGNRVRIDWGSPDSAAVATAVGFQSLAQTIRFLDSHLALGRSNKIQAVIDAYTQDLGGSEDRKPAA